MRKIKFLFSFLMIFILIFSVSLPCFGNESIYVWSNSSTPVNNTNAQPVSDNSLNLESPSAILIEQTTGQVLYEHNSHEKLRPASVTKVMSILLIMEAIHNR